MSKIYFEKEGFPEIVYDSEGVEYTIKRKKKRRQMSP